MGISIMVTGAEGYLGKLVIKALAEHKRDISTLLAYDIKEPVPQNKLNDVIYIQGDIRSAGISEYLKQYKIDTVIHLASIVSPGKNSSRDLEYSVDVKGTENLLHACVKNGVTHFIVTSSGAAYGYHHDNPEWLAETDAIRGNEEFSYSRNKRLVEEMLNRYRSDFPELKQLVLRPGTILGEQTNNQITDLFKKWFVFGIKGSDIPFVFIWDKDVVNIIVKGALYKKEGIYNLAGDGFLTLKQIADKLGKPFIHMPAGLLKIILSILKRSGLSQYGPDQINFLRYRPVLSNKKLKEEFGYTPRLNSEQVFDYYLESNYRKTELHKKVSLNLKDLS